MELYLSSGERSVLRSSRLKSPDQSILGSVGRVRIRGKVEARPAEIYNGRRARAIPNQKLRWMASRVSAEMGDKYSYK